MKNPIILGCVLLALYSGCSKFSEKSNMALKAKLQGTWVWKGLNEKVDHNEYRKIELSFQQSKLNWRDSIVIYNITDSLIVDLFYEYGSNVVYYRFNDGKAPISYGSALTYELQKMDVNDVVWIDVGEHTVEDYTIIDGVLTMEFTASSVGTAGHPIHSSAIKFSNEDKRAKFCQSILTGSPHCFTFVKVN